mgnify:FL=1
MSFLAKQFRVARPTQQLEKVIEFYTKGLGLEIIGEFHNHAGYDGVMIGDKHLPYHLEFTFHPAHTQTHPPGNENLLVFYFETETEWQQTQEQIRNLGYTPVAPENPYWLNNSVTFEDPDGWRVVLYNGLYAIK